MNRSSQRSLRTQEVVHALLQHAFHHMAGTAREVNPPLIVTECVSRLADGYTQSFSARAERTAQASLACADELVATARPDVRLELHDLYLESPATARNFADALKKLDRADYELGAMSFVGGMTVDEVSEVLNQHSNEVHRASVRVRDSLRDEICRQQYADATMQ